MLWTRIKLEDRLPRVEEENRKKLMRLKDKKYEGNIGQNIISCDSPSEGAVAVHDSLTPWLANSNYKY